LFAGKAKKNIDKTFLFVYMRYYFKKTLLIHELIYSKHYRDYQSDRKLRNCPVARASGSQVETTGPDNDIMFLKIVTKPVIRLAW